MLVKCAEPMHKRTKLIITRRVRSISKFLRQHQGEVHGTHRLSLLGDAHADAVRDGHVPERWQELRLPRAQLDFPHPHRRLHLSDVVRDDDLKLPLRIGRL